jgi:hypothetical protein
MWPTLSGPGSSSRSTRLRGPNSSPCEPRVSSRSEGDAPARGRGRLRPRGPVSTSWTASSRLPPVLLVPDDRSHRPRAARSDRCHSSPDCCAQSTAGWRSRSESDLQEDPTESRLGDRLTSVFCRERAVINSRVRGVRTSPVSHASRRDADASPKMTSAARYTLVKESGMQELWGSRMTEGRRRAKVP